MPFAIPTHAATAVAPTSSGRAPWRAPILGVGGLLAASLAASALAQSPASYPNRPIRMIVGFAPGGPADITARAISPRMGELLGQPITIENRGGAAGSIGSEVVARAAPDGYTLLLASQSTFVFAPWLYNKFPFDPVRDFTPISTVVITPFVIAVNPRVPAKNIADLIRLGKGKKGWLTFGSSGPGATSHIGGELLQVATGLSLLHVPYKGTGPSVAAVVAGEIDMMIADLGPVQGHAKDGRLRLLAAVGSRRSPAAPDLPTLLESGLKVQPLDGRFGIMAPAGLPKDLTARLHQVMVQVVKTPDVRQRFEALGYEPVGDTPEQYAQSVRVELEVFGKIIRNAGIKPE
jgi:tripartite-type tricarboxylate transporter receptor subunit TctC